MSDDILCHQTLRLLSYLIMSSGTFKATPSFHNLFYSSVFYSLVMVSRGLLPISSWTQCPHMSPLRLSQMLERYVFQNIQIYLEKS